MFTSDEIARKLPVWHALAQLFLDTETQPHDYACIARQFKASGFSVEEFRQILETEVAPAFAFNIFDVAGEWTHWNEEEVRQIMIRHQAEPTRWIKQKRLLKIVSRMWADLLPRLDP